MWNRLASALVVVLASSCGSRLTPSNGSLDDAVACPEACRGESGPPISVCNPIEIRADRVLDIDLRPLDIELCPTLDGRPWPADRPASFRLAAEAASGTAWHSISTDSDGDCQKLAVLPGRYAIEYIGFPHEGPAAAGDPPNGSYRLPDRMTVTQPGRHGLDVRAHLVSGRATMDGRPLESGSVCIGTMVCGNGNIRGGRHATTVPAGTYDVHVQGVPGCGPAGCTALVARGLEVGGPRSLDIALQSSELFGRVVRPSGDWPTDEPGTLLLAIDDSWFTQVVEVDRFGYFRQRVPQGTYRARWSVDWKLPAGQVLARQVKARTPLTVPAPGAAEIVLDQVRIDGRFVVDGVPVSAQQKPQLHFLPVSATTPHVCVGETSVAPVGPTGEFSLHLAPGDYKVWLVSMERRFMARILLPTWQFPVGGVTHVERDTTLTFDVETVRVEGRVAVDGRPVGPTLEPPIVFWPTSEPLVDWERPCFGRGPEPLGAHMADGRYSARLPRGRYDVWWRTDNLQCRRAGGPCADAPLALDVAFERDTVTNFEVRTVGVRGWLTVGGEPLPGGWGSSHPSLRWASPRPPGLFGSASLSFFGGSALATRLIPGPYRVHLSSEMVGYVPECCPSPASTPR